MIFNHLYEGNVNRYLKQYRYYYFLIIISCLNDTIKDFPFSEDHTDAEETQALKVDY